MDQMGCDHCLPGDATTAWQAQRGHVTVMRVIDEPHHSVTVLACPRCAQRFVKVFSETIDWIDGDDPQHWELMPLTEHEADRLVVCGNQLSDADLAGLPARRSLRADHPTGAHLTVAWSVGIAIHHHD